MKKILPLILLFTGSVASAQIVNIPDPVFKAALIHNSSVDMNLDGEIQVSEAEAMISLNLTADAGNITDLAGLGAFINVQALTIYESGGHFPGATRIILPGLKRFSARNVNIPTLDMRACDSLKYASFGWGSDSQYDSINVAGLSRLDTIDGVGDVNHLMAANCSSLKVITSQIISEIDESLDVTNCTSLRLIYITAYGAPTLDLSTCTSGVDFHLEASAGNLILINLKNGAQDYMSSGDFAFQNPLVYLCVDTFELNSILPGYINWPGPTTVLRTSNCSYYPGGSFNTIAGTIKLDADNNGCSVADPSMQNIPVSVTDNFNNTIVRYTDVSGEYAHYCFAGDYTLTPGFTNPYFTISPNPGTVQFPNSNHLIDTTDFCITPNGAHNDLQISLYPYGPARPGFTADYLVVFRNKGTTTLSGDVQLNYDNTRMSFISSQPSVTTQTPGQLGWNYSNLQPFETRNYYVGFNIFAPPVNNIGDTLDFLGSVNPVVGDETAIDNSATLHQVITGAYDPNDKTCAEGRKLDIVYLNKNLHYIVHFQNLGTDTAFNVVVADTLTNNVDWDSFDFLGSSHPCHVTRKHNKIEFYFENIKLPCQAVNNAGSNGYVIFNVKPKNTLAVGDSVNNTASIYFDYNLPVVTNKAITIVSPGSALNVTLEYFSLNNKEKNNLLTWKVATTDLSATFNIERSSDGIHFNSIGNLTATAQRCQLPFNFTDDKTLNGKNYYRIKITAANGVVFYSKILVTGNTRSGFGINAIVSNQNNTTLYLEATKDQNVQMKIVAADGRFVYSQNKTITAGTNQMRLSTGSLSKGIYTLIVYTSEGEIITKRFLR